MRNYNGREESAFLLVIPNGFSREEPASPFVIPNGFSREELLFSLCHSERLQP